MSYLLGDDFGNFKNCCKWLWQLCSSIQGKKYFSKDKIALLSAVDVTPCQPRGVDISYFQGCLTVSVVTPLNDIRNFEFRSHILNPIICNARSISTSVNACSSIIDAIVQIPEKSRDFGTLAVCQYRIGNYYIQHDREMVNELIRRFCVTNETNHIYLQDLTYAQGKPVNIQNGPNTVVCVFKPTLNGNNRFIKVSSELASFIVVDPIATPLDTDRDTPVMCKEDETPVLCKDATLFEVRHATLRILHNSNAWPSLGMSINTHSARIYFVSSSYDTTNCDTVSELMECFRAAPHLRSFIFQCHFNMSVKSDTEATRIQKEFDSQFKEVKKWASTKKDIDMCITRSLVIILRTPQSTPTPNINWIPFSLVHTPDSADDVDDSSSEEYRWPVNRRRRQYTYNRHLSAATVLPLSLRNAVHSHIDVPARNYGNVKSCTIVNQKWHNDEPIITTAILENETEIEDGIKKLVDKGNSVRNVACDNFAANFENKLCYPTFDV